MVTTVPVGRTRSPTSTSTRLIRSVKWHSWKRKRNGSFNPSKCLVHRLPPLDHNLPHHHDHTPIPALVPLRGPTRTPTFNPNHNRCRNPGSSPRRNRIHTRSTHKIIWGYPAWPLRGAAPSSARLPRLRDQASPGRYPPSLRHIAYRPCPSSSASASTTGSILRRTGSSRVSSPHMRTKRLGKRISHNTTRGFRRP
jgi:hypothetical protein